MGESGAYDHPQAKPPKHISTLRFARSARASARWRARAQRAQFCPAGPFFFHLHIGGSVVVIHIRVCIVIVVILIIVVVVVIVVNCCCCKRCKLLLIVVVVVVVNCC